MKKTNKILVAVIIVAVIIIGIGYAAIENITLRIAGTATADPSQSNFAVKFSGEPTVSDANKITAARTDDRNATINVTGLMVKGDSATATYIIQNTSADLSAKLSAIVSNSNEEYFKVTYKFGSENIIKGEATTIDVTVELLKTPINEAVNSTIGLQITAEPIQPE